VGFEPTDPCGSPVFKTAKSPVVGRVFSLTCLGKCLCCVEMCRNVSNGVTSFTQLQEPRLRSAAAVLNLPRLRRGRRQTAAAALRRPCGVGMEGRRALPRLRWPGAQKPLFSRRRAPACLARLRGPLHPQACR